MPQMAPLNWVLLMIMFIIMFLSFNILVYYSFLYKPKLLTLKPSTNQVNWKW